MVYLSETFKWECETHYKMDHNKRGVALVFNHHKFKDESLELREGTDTDCDSIIKSMEKLGFDVVVCTDFTEEQVMDELRTIANIDHTDNDCLAIFVLTHGNKSHLCAYDKEYLREKLWLSFTADACKSLAGKPKLIFIQACRATVAKGEKSSNTDAVLFESNEVSSSSLHSDFVVYNASVDGFLSYRDSEGSWFIQTLCKVLDKMAYQDDLLSLFTIVNKTVGVEYSKGEGASIEKQMPMFKSQLMFKLQFTEPKGEGTVVYKH